MGAPAPVQQNDKLKFEVQQNRVDPDLLVWIRWGFRSAHYIGINLPGNTEMAGSAADWRRIKHICIIAEIS